jgi:hypothetical protein
VIGRNGYIVNDHHESTTKANIHEAIVFRPFPFFSANGFHVRYLSAFDFSAIQFGMRQRE